jgi:hypothetical protein
MIQGHARRDFSAQSLVRLTVSKASAPAIARRGAGDSDDTIAVLIGRGWPQPAPIGAAFSVERRESDIKSEAFLAHAP